MTTDPSREAFERELIDNHHYVPSDFSFKDGVYGGNDDYIQFGWDVWQAAIVHKEADRWLPIESAPSDGRYLLLWEQYSEAPFVGYWVNDRWGVCHEHVDAEGGWDGAIVVDKLQCPITHWMPLPAAPLPHDDTIDT